MFRYWIAICLIGHWLTLVQTWHYLPFVQLRTLGLISSFFDLCISNWQLSSGFIWVNCLNLCYDAGLFWVVSSVLNWKLRHTFQDASKLSWVSYITGSLPLLGLYFIDLHRLTSSYILVFFFEVRVGTGWVKTLLRWLWRRW